MIVFACLDHTIYLILMLYPLSPEEMPTSCPDPLSAHSLLSCPKLMPSILSCSLVLHAPSLTKLMPVLLQLVGPLFSSLLLHHGNHLS